jgi:hypothetical protein
MPPTETVERGTTRDAAVPETHSPEPGVGPTPEGAGPETRSAKQGVPVWVLLAAIGAMTVAWVGALVALTWWLIRAIL